MHLCGRLSLIFIEAFQKISQVKKMILCPCCMDNCYSNKVKINKNKNKNKIKNKNKQNRSR